MKRLLAINSMIVVYTSLAFAGGGIIPLEQDFPTKEHKVKQWFIYVAGGKSSLDISTKLTLPDPLNDGALDDSGTLLEVGGGYRFSDNIFTTLAYQHTALDIVTIHNLYVSINYQFSDVIFKPYVGILGGYSQLVWDERPHPVLPSEDLSSESAMYGIQAGMEYRLNDRWNLFAKYQYIVYDHTMDIKQGGDIIDHNSANNILIGVRYAF
jgi:opacity protein-like surface antigen